MAITTIDNVIAGRTPVRWFFKGPSPLNVNTGSYTSWYHGGIPGPGTTDTTTAGGVTLTAPQQGQLVFNNPVSGETRLSKFFLNDANNANSSTSQLILICDRLWHCGNINAGITSSQTITSPTWPARDEDGLTNGKGVLIGLEAMSTMGTGVPTVTLTYTNSAGTGSRTGTLWRSWVGSTFPGFFAQFLMAAGDLGVKQVNSVQLSVSTGGGTIALVAYRVLAAVAMTAQYNLGLDPITGCLPKLYDGTVPFFITYGASTSHNFQGVYSYTQG